MYTHQNPEAKEERDLTRSLDAGSPQSKEGRCENLQELLSRAIIGGVPISHLSQRETWAKLHRQQRTATINKLRSPWGAAPRGSSASE